MRFYKIVASVPLSLLLCLWPSTSLTHFVGAQEVGSKAHTPKYNRIKFQPPSPLIPTIRPKHNGRNTKKGGHRKLADESDYKPIRIKFYSESLKQTIDDNNSSSQQKARGEAIIQQVLPEVQAIWEQTLSVIPLSNLVIPEDVCFNLYDVPEVWSKSTAGLPDTDLIIFVSAFNKIGATELCSQDAELSTLAVSSPCAIDPDNDRPVVGFANVCLNTIVMDSSGKVNQDSINSLVDVMSHELVHVLGLNSELFKYFRNSKTGHPLTKRKKNFLGKDVGFEVVDDVPCVGEQSNRSLEMPCENTVRYMEEEYIYGEKVESRGFYEVVLPTVAQVARNQFNCPSLEGVRLENQPTSEDCMGSHFDERTWFTEFMSAVYDKEAAYFSPLTLAFLEDTGWYKCDFTQASNSPFGLGAGCGFVEKACIVGGKVPSYGKGFFCDDKKEKTWKCGPSHTFRGSCDLEEFKYPSKTYFEPAHVGPKFTHADYCPMAIATPVDCNDATATKLHPEIEVFDEASKCIDVIKGGSKSSICLKTLCNKERKSLDFEVANKIYSCSKDYEVIKVGDVASSTYEFHCPRLTQMCPDMYCPAMCSGKGICDWAQARPICICFDKSDTTDGCYQSSLNEQSKCNSSTSSGSQISSLPSILILILLPTFVISMSTSI